MKDDLSYVHWSTKIQSYGGVGLTLGRAYGVLVPIRALVLPKSCLLSAWHCDWNRDKSFASRAGWGPWVRESVWESLCLALLYLSKPTGTDVGSPSHSPPRLVFCASTWSTKNESRFCFLGFTQPMFWGGSSHKRTCCSLLPKTLGPMPHKALCLPWKLGLIS